MLGFSLGADRENAAGDLDSGKEDFSSQITS
jgi:hypothetical protein